MEHEERRKMKTAQEIQDYIDALVRQGIKARDAVPALYRWCWRIGINIAPPFMQSFLAQGLFCGFGGLAAWQLE